MASQHSVLLIRRVHGMTAIRIVRGYRTISGAVAKFLAEFPSREVYVGTRGLGNGGGAAVVKMHAQQKLLARWRSSGDRGNDGTAKCEHGVPAARVGDAE
ncbi:unnamed protein product [Heterotrigona itama]|uniref:Uncharacterized protein n=1 Tax=Heterotrigona itama TaxID=395501 RepID=A0A6V7HK98_9HYME|nr:unnamed protein product [Heterotrigona itama]